MEKQVQTPIEIRSLEKTGSLTDAMATQAACDIRGKDKEQRDW
jgi:hypothetical protein